MGYKHLLSIALATALSTACGNDVESQTVVGAGDSDVVKLVAPATVVARTEFELWFESALPHDGFRSGDEAHLLQGGEVKWDLMLAHPNVVDRSVDGDYPTADRPDGVFHTVSVRGAGPWLAVAPSEPGRYQLCYAIRHSAPTSESPTSVRYEPCSDLEVTPA